MTPTQFVDSIRVSVLESAVVGSQQLLTRPPPDPVGAHLQEVSEWVKSLSEREREYILRIIQLAAGQATFGFLAVLDGVRAIEVGSSSGLLELRFLNDKESVVLNPKFGPMLHELL